MPSPFHPARLVPTSVRAGFWTLRGRRRLRKGEVRRAVMAFERGLALNPGRFRTLVDLATAHLCARDIFQARSALARAREADPEGFPARAGPLLARWGFDLDAVVRMTSFARPEAVAQTAGLRRRTVSASSLPFGDCRNLDEYARFRAMPPISQAEIASWDIDRIIGDLLDG